MPDRDDEGGSESLRRLLPGRHDQACESYATKLPERVVKATISTGREYGTDRPCEIGRITYRAGAHSYVAIAFRYEDSADWRLTWVGHEGSEPAQLPDGIAPSAEMIAALAAEPMEGSS